MDHDAAITSVIRSIEEVEIEYQQACDSNDALLCRVHSQMLRITELEAALRMQV